ncbi:MAG: ABC transporter ATP-binding protein [Austwickia sp.]|jgi:iron complex transport system ATP-binding protein|nr:MAG: ABC transporter ATP-binding protein [Austwickia sp.]
MSDVLEFAGVSVVRGGATLLDEIDWAIEEGERWVVLGPNGAGKTTLLQIAAARMHPTRGVASVLSEILGAVDVFELRPRIGLASSALAERVPERELVRDVVLTASYGVVGRWREQYERLDVSRARRLLGTLGAEHLSERTYGTLSEGERKRVLIARALMTDPELMLLDEPAAGLDLGGREDLVHRLGEIASDIEAPALVLVTHHVEEIPPGFTDVLLLRGGRVVAAGPIGMTLTQANLEATFGLPLHLERYEDRWAARARTPEPGETGPWLRSDPEPAGPGQDAGELPVRP